MGKMLVLVPRQAFPSDESGAVRLLPSGRRDGDDQIFEQL